MAADQNRTKKSNPSSINFRGNQIQQLGGLVELWCAALRDADWKIAIHRSRRGRASLERLQRTNRLSAFLVQRGRTHHRTSTKSQSG